ncbi:polysaccharide deacetylase family protein [Desulfopila aestuarii]|nr:polysaccharide deacetylase family protein [Desulfopila aestuarii]
MRFQLSPYILDKGLNILSKKYSFISITEAIDMLTGVIPIKPYSMVLTFDDGYRNNLSHALPILSKYNAPAAIFLSTGHIYTNEPYWYDRMDYALQHLKCNIQFEFESNLYNFPPNNPFELSQSFHNLRYALKSSPSNYLSTLSKINEILSLLENNSHGSLYDIFENDPWTSLLNWDEIKIASKKGIYFGSHTVDHLLLGKVNSQVVLNQLSISKQHIENNTGQSCQILCYPDGDYTPEVIKLAQNCGYKAGLSIRGGINHPGQKNIFLLSRNSFPNRDNYLSIHAGASGLTAFFQRIRLNVNKHT